MKKILVVVDMQNDFITGALGTKEAQAIVPKVVEKIKNFDGYKLYTTMDSHGSDYLETQEGKNLPVEHCIKYKYVEGKSHTQTMENFFDDIEYNEGWELHPEIESAIYDLGERLDLDSILIDIEKGSFGATELIEHLQFTVDGYDEREFEIELVGVCTDICVISNALMVKSYFPEIKIIVDSSCCAGATPESHKNALEAMKMCQINII